MSPTRMNEPIQRMKRVASLAATLTLLAAAGLSWACASTGEPLSKEKKERQPAEVMSWRGARWLERDTREQEERPDILFEIMGLSRGDIVADVGCGTGFYARRMAKLVAPEGRVYAVDIQPEMLEFMKELAAKESVSGIVPILGELDDPKLPAGSLDWILLVDVYHEFQDPESILAQLRKALTPDGRIALVEYRLEGDTARHIRRDHRMSPDQVKEEWIPAGFELIEQNESLPSQHVFVFKRAALPVSLGDPPPLGNSNMGTKSVFDRYPRELIVLTDSG